MMICYGHASHVALTLQKQHCLSTHALPLCMFGTLPTGPGQETSVKSRWILELMDGVPPISLNYPQAKAVILQLQVVVVSEWPCL